VASKNKNNMMAGATGGTPRFGEGAARRREGQTGRNVERAPHRRRSSEVAQKPAPRGF